MPYQKLFYDPSLIYSQKTVPIDKLELVEFEKTGIQADVLRLDKIHPIVSGNKWFKLKNYLLDAAKKECTTLLSFGGAYSNHIIATAYAAEQAGFRSIGIVRGEEPAQFSHTLQTARQYGMQLEFESRGKYKCLQAADSLGYLSEKFPGSYIIPEGGYGIPGISGSEEILRLVQKNTYTHIICAIGTGTTYLGLVNASGSGQSVTGISVLKGMRDLLQEFKQYFNEPSKINHCRIQYGYHFGGYAKKKPELIDFMNRLYELSGIPTDFVYTAKMFYGVVDLAKKDYFPAGSRLLLVHSGGLQGNQSLPLGTLNF